jgi:hypothetical protein
MDHARPDFERDRDVGRAHGRGEAGRRGFSASSARMASISSCAMYADRSIVVRSRGVGLIRLPLGKRRPVLHDVPCRYKCAKASISEQLGAARRGAALRRKWLSLAFSVPRRGRRRGQDADLLETRV